MGRGSIELGGVTRIEAQDRNCEMALPEFELASDRAIEMGRVAGCAIRKSRKGSRQSTPL
jgi:hypothetical protein